MTTSKRPAMKAPQFCVVLSTTDSAELAERIARELVEQELAACVNIIPKITSIYRWKNKVETAKEWLLIIKTRKPLTSKVESVIKKLHIYTSPECVVIPIESGSKDYLNWILDSTK